MILGKQYEVCRMKRSGAFISQAIINYILTIVVPQSHHPFKIMALKEKQITAPFFAHKESSCLSEK